MEMHGSIDKPLEVPELEQGKYVNWEYSHINRTGLFHYCLQQLLREKEGTREFDRMVVRDYSGRHHVFYFDITKAMKIRGKEMKKAYEATAARELSYKEPDEVSEAFMHALFDDNPLRRYMVVPNAEEQEFTIRTKVNELVQLNEWGPYSYSRDQLVELLDEALSGDAPSE